MKSPLPIRCLAIANRGEAAMRCIRTVKSLRAREGIALEVVALYTDVDRGAPFVRHADRALPIAPAATPVAAYLDRDGLIQTLRAAGADAVWPGWGFLAEDPVFVDRCNLEGIRFLGPPPTAMRTLGDKIDAKVLAASAGVPVLPWSGAAIADESEATRIAKEIGYPLLVKASAGGGGRGIRFVHAESELAAAFRSARAEALTAFGDDRVFLESAVRGGRHVEVQIVADAHGNVHALGCRDCSVQRRHQKVLEEAPPPGLSRAFLAALEEDSRRLAAAVGYRGVGTVEFLVAGSAYHFLEMNPRLQVEHGITEALTGLDLVELQIRVARGESLAELAWREEGAAIEARVCAEDPDAGFLPTPGRIACFDAALGPRVRVDSGVTLDTVVPGAFDSLIAKVIASGGTREEARARLACALADFELLIEGGATNKGFLIDLLDTPDFRAGGVDTGWLDRLGATSRGMAEHAVEALVAAAIIAYQRARQATRLNFFADTTTLSTARIPPSEGLRIDLTYRGEAYQLQVYAMGAWRYRVHLEGRVAAATLREESSRSGRLLLGNRSLRLLYDPTEAGLRVEIEGRPHRFGWQVAGEVRASTPAMVVSIDVKPGDRVELGRPLGFLEAMKMEIGFDAPVAGVVKEVRARKGQQVAAGEVLLVIEPAGETEQVVSGQRLAFSEEPDPLALLFRTQGDGSLGAAALAAADRAEPGRRREAMDAIRGEVRRVFLGYDTNVERAEKLVGFLEAELPDELSEGFRWQLAEIRHEIHVVADVDQLFIRSPRGSVGAEQGISNNARLRMFVRRIRAGGAGIAPEFLDLVRHALGHYGITRLDHSDALERAVLRLLATQRSGEIHDRLLLAVLRCVTRLASSGIHLGDDRALQDALARLASMRGLVSDAVADAALEASYVIFERPAVEREAERTSKRLEAWLAAAEADPTAPPEEVLRTLIDAPRPVFDRVGDWIADPDPRRRAIALAAHLRRAYSPLPLASHSSELHGPASLYRLELSASRVVLGAACSAADVHAMAQLLCDAAANERDRHEWPAVYALELFVALPEAADVVALAESVRVALGGGLPAGRFTLSLVAPGGPDRHFTFVPSREGLRLDHSLHRVHPEAALRIDLARLAKFELERCDAPDGLYCFHGRARDEAGDERVFVLADVRGRSPDDGHEAELYVPLFEQAFYEATRALRTLLGLRDPKRLLQWNRVTICVAPVVALDRGLAARISQRLAPAVRNLGIEKVVARLRLIERDQPEKPPVPIEVVITDITGSNMEIEWRTPRRSALEPRTDYERRVAEARRRRLVYPYEIVRMLTGNGKPAGATSREDDALPVGTFEEYDLDPERAEPTARSVSGRPFGRNASAIVFGVIRTPTDKVPEGMERVLVLSDPTQGMGALAGPECDRLVAAIDLAEARGVPVEWVPVSSGAKIAMDSGTENLDATARVVRRIVTFTQRNGTIHVIVPGVNVGAQSYFDALATMLMHTRGALIMTPGASMVLTGRASLEASGGVAAEDEVGIGGYERIMGPSGQAQYFAVDLGDAYRILYDHYRYTYVVPGERGPRASKSADPRRAQHRPVPVRRRGLRVRDGRARSSTTRRTRAGRGRSRCARVMARGRRPGRRAPRALAAVGGRRDRDRLGRGARRHPGDADRHREPERRRARATGPSTAPRRGAAERSSRSRRRRWRAR